MLNSYYLMYYHLWTIFQFNFFIFKKCLICVPLFLGELTEFTKTRLQPRHLTCLIGDTYLLVHPYDILKVLHSVLP